MEDRSRREFVSRAFSIGLACAMMTGAFVAFLAYVPNASATVYFTEDFEGGIGNWVVGGYWHLVDDTLDPCAVGAHSWTSSIGYHMDATCDYDDGAQNWGAAELAVDIDLTTATRARLTFKSWLEDEPGGWYENVEVEISDDGGTSWNWVADVNDPDYLRAVWTQVEVNLTSWVGSNIRVRFWFDTVDDWDNGYRGWFVDDVIVDDDYTVATTDFFSEDFETGFPGWSSTPGSLWHPVNDGLDPCVGGPWDYRGAHSPVTAWGFHTDVTCDYNTGFTETGRLVSPDVDLRAATSARLTFWSWFETEFGAPVFDVKWAQVSDDFGATWSDLVEVEVAGTEWRKWQFVEVDLTAWAGNVIQIGFYFDSVDPAANDWEGWYVDNVKVIGERYTLYSEWQAVAPVPDGAFPAGEHIMSLVNSVDLGTIPSNPFAVWLILENDADYLYLTFDAVGDTTGDLADMSGFYLDTDRNLALTDGADDLFVVDAAGMFIAHSLYDAGLGTWSFEDACDPGFDPQHAGLACTVGFGPSPNSAMDHRIYEFRIPLVLIEVPIPVQQGYMMGLLAVVYDDFIWDNTVWPFYTLALPPMVAFGDIVLAAQPNTPPVLDWTGEVGYTTDGLEPETGPETTVFTYRIMYQDADNNPPAPFMPYVRIRDGGIDIPGSPFSMMLDYFVGAPGDFTVGAVYTFDTSLVCGGNYDYRFEAQDILGGGTTTMYIPGPVVPCNNNPLLTHTGEPYFVNDYLHPQLGDETTSFEWRVTYSDTDNDPPGPGEPLVHIMDFFVDIPGSPFSMSFDSWVGAAGDYTAGAIYTYSTTLPCTGFYNYYFETTDGMGGSFVTWGWPGPDVLCMNSAPALDWTGEPNYIGDGLDPETGDEATTFTYRISFTDTDGDLPMAGEPLVSILESGVDMLGSPFSMTEVDPVITYFWDDFETGSPGWTATGFWHEVNDLTDPCAIVSWSSDHSWGYHIDGSCNYDDGARNFGELESPLIDLTTATSPQLSLRDWHLVEFGVEYLGIEVSDDGGATWTMLDDLGSNGMYPLGRWNEIQLDLSFYAGATINIRFNFDTLNPFSNFFHGWFVDDVWVYEGDANTMDGKLYTFDTTLAPCGGSYSYIFTATDENGGAAIPTTELFAPTVSCIPVLDWTGEPNYVSDGLDPETGQEMTTVFVYSIKYSEGENEAPMLGHPLIHILDMGADIPGSPFQTSLGFWVGVAGDYVAGAVYNYSTVLAAGADYSYYFEATDSGGSSATPTLTELGPTVAIVGNDPPEARDVKVEGFAPGSVEIMHITNLVDPLFNWSYFDPDVPPAPQTNYQVRVGSAPNLDDIWAPAPPGVAGLSIAYSGPALNPGTTYYFAVHVHDGAQWSGWNETEFHTNGPPPAPTTPVVPPPGAPNVIAGAGTTVEWTSGGPDPEGDTVTYHWQVATDTLFTVIVASGSTTGTLSDGFTTATTTIYYWRVNATDGIDWSAYGNDPPGYWEFTTGVVTDEPPAASFLGVDGFPSGSGGILHILSDTPDLNWTYTDPEGAPQAQYEVRVGTAPGLNDMWAFGAAAAVFNVTYAGAPLVDGTDYYFAVRVHDGTKWSSDWNETMFHMNAPPPIPTLDWPPDGATDIMPGDIDLGWNGVTDPDGDPVTYYWYISEQSDFTPLEDSGTTTSATAAFTAQPETTYYWKVEAYDGYYWSGNSTTFEFTTIAAVGTITGTVVDDETDDPIEGAMVRLLDHGGDVVETETTDADGDFEFTDIDFDTYSVEVTKSGYEDYLEEDVTISSSSPDEDIDIRLTQKPTAEIDWMLILIPLIIIIIVIIVIIALLMMRRKKPEEAPPVQPPAVEQAPVYYPPAEQPPTEAPPEQPPQETPPEEPPTEVPPETPPEQPPTQPPEES